MSNMGNYRFIILTLIKLKKDDLPKYSMGKINRKIDRLCDSILDLLGSAAGGSGESSKAILGSCSKVSKDFMI